MGEELDPAIQAQLRTDVASMKTDLTDVKQSINRIADALTKLAILEDRQSAQTTLMEKSLDRLEALEEKQHATELRFATGMISQERLTNVEQRLNSVGTQLTTIGEKLTRYEAGGRAISHGVKAFWAVFGGAISSAVLYLLMNAPK